MNWNSVNGKFNVNRYNPDNRDDDLRAREEVSKLKEAPLMRGFFTKPESYFKYFIQPFIILEISCKPDSKFIYFLFSIIFNSWVILISLFKTSIFIRAICNVENFSPFDSKAAVITKFIISRQMPSIFK